MKHQMFGIGYEFDPSVLYGNLPSSPATKAREGVEQALREVNASDAWHPNPTRTAIRRGTLEALATGAWSQGYDDGYAQAKRDVLDALGRD